MKNSELYTPTSSNSWAIVFLLLVLLLISSISINAQSLTKKTVFDVETTSDYIVKAFNVKAISNMLYFKFLVMENQENIAYTLESSSNGSDFYAVQLKEGFKSPEGTPLLYCYAVDVNTLNDKTYRIRRDTKEGVVYSEVLQITDAINPNFSAQTN